MAALSTQCCYLWKVKTIRGEIIKGARMFKVKNEKVGPCKADETIIAHQMHYNCTSNTQ